MGTYIGRRRLSVFKFTKIIAKVALCPFFRIHVKGLEGLPEGISFVLMPKHQRWEDIPILGLSIGRPLYYIAKYELFQNVLSRWYISSLGGIPVNRKRPLESRESFKMMMELLRTGEGIVIFPEGTYYRNSMGAGHIGLIRMILSRLAIPFIPVGIRYSKRGWKINVGIKIGRPYYGDQSTSIEELIDHIMKEIASLSGLSKKG